MRSRLALLAFLTTACRVATDKPSDGAEAPSDAADTAATVEDSGEAWYEYDEGGDDDAGGSDGDDKDEEEEGEKEFEACGDDFDPDEPCEGTWETGAICYEGDTIWYCEDGVWQNK